MSVSASLLQIGLLDRFSLVLAIRNWMDRAIPELHSEIRFSFCLLFLFANFICLPRWEQTPWSVPQSLRHFWNLDSLVCFFFPFVITIASTHQLHRLGIFVGIRRFVSLPLEGQTSVNSRFVTLPRHRRWKGIHFALVLRVEWCWGLVLSSFAVRFSNLFFGVTFGIAFVGSVGSPKRCYRLERICEL